jgi:hypothetical protein
MGSVKRVVVACENNAPKDNIKHVSASFSTNVLGKRKKLSVCANSAKKG